LNRLSRAHERYRRQTTDRQTTDGRAIAYSEREREFTFAKNSHINSCTFNFSRQQPDWADFINNIVIHTMFLQQVVSV